MVTGDIGQFWGIICITGLSIKNGILCVSETVTVHGPRNASTQTPGPLSNATIDDLNQES